MQGEAISMSSGHTPTSEDPIWVLVHEPTYRQLHDPGVIEVAGHKIHGGIGLLDSYPKSLRGPGWNWWLKMDRFTSWFVRGEPGTAYIGFDPDEGRRIDKLAKDETARPGRWERGIMKDQGERALHAFINSLDGSNLERAAYIASIAPVSIAVGYGDLPAAIRIALTTGLPDLYRARLVHLLEEEMIYWPDFQRKDSTTAKSTIQHHLPSVGSSLTISGSGTTSGTSFTISASVTTHGGATG